MRSDSSDTRLSAEHRTQLVNAISEMKFSANTSKTQTRARAYAHTRTHLIAPSSRFSSECVYTDAYARALFV